MDPINQTPKREKKNPYNIGHAYYSKSLQKLLQENYSSCYDF